MSTHSNPCYVYCGPMYGHPHRILTDNGNTFTVETLDGAKKFKAHKCDVEMPFICDRCHRGYHITTFGVDGLCPECTKTLNRGAGESSLSATEAGR